MAIAAPIEKLAVAIGRLVTIVGHVATDAVANKRANADMLKASLRKDYPDPKELSASIDLPSGRSGRLRVLSLRKEERVKARGFSEEEVQQLIVDIQTVMEAEMPVILPRWAFDQVIRPWLGEMQLSASMVLSNQRTVLMVDNMLMVRISKMMSDPRSQMVTLQEQTVRTIEGDTDRRRGGLISSASSIDS